MHNLSVPRLLAIASFGFALTLFSNTLDPALYGYKVLQLAPDNPNTLLGFSTAAGSLLVLLMGPLVGLLSDRTRSPLGRRLPYFLIGVPLMIAGLFTVGLAPAVWVFVLGVLLWRFGDNIIFAPWEALYADRVPAAQRGLASGLKSLTEILAVLLGRLAAGELLSRQLQLGDAAIYAAMAVPVAGLLLALLFTWLGMRDEPYEQGEPVREPLLKTYIDSFRFDWRGQSAFRWWFANRFLFWVGFVTLSQFLLLFVVDVVGLPEADAQRYLARLSLVLGGAILAVAVPSGRLADRFGRAPVVIAACLMAALGTTLVLFLRDLNWLTLAAGLIGCGAGTYLSANFAQLTDIVPKPEAGRYIGLAGIAGAAGGTVARLLGGLLIDPLNTLTPDGTLGYLALYGLAAILFVAAAWVASFRAR
ncbi:MAG: MFS transporter [Anaerolineales bacterium]|nr:MFS transporter [Anaerolineales bacterium]